MLGFLINLLTACVIAGLIGIWWFWKKRPDKKYLAISIAGTVLSFALFGLFSDMNKTKETVSKQIEITTTQTTQTQTTKSETTTTQTESETTQQVKNDGPEYTDESNAQFASYLTTEINNKLSDSGYQVTAQAISDSLIYLYVPQEIKYGSKSEIQQIADILYNVKENTFSTWAIDNGYDLGFTYSPAIYVKSEDGTTLAEESGILNKSMKVKVDN